MRRSELVAHPLERLIAIAGWGAMLFLLFPVVFTTVVSFGAGELIEFPPAGWSLRWYAHIGEIHRVGAAVLYSLLIATCAGVLATLLAIGVALCLVRLAALGAQVVRTRRHQAHHCRRRYPRAWRYCKVGTLWCHHGHDRFDVRRS